MRRFIAGAKCPRCGELDKLFVAATDSGQRRECVVCGFQDSLENLPPEGVQTRLDRTAAPAAVAEPVRLVDPGAPRRP